MAAHWRCANEHSQPLIYQIVLLQHHIDPCRLSSFSKDTKHLSMGNHDAFILSI